MHTCALGKKEMYLTHAHEVVYNGKLKVRSQKAGTIKILLEKKTTKKSSSKKKKNYVKIMIEKRWAFEKMVAIPCIVYENLSWFIVDGFAIDQYFTVEKSSDEEHYKITGLLEPMAQVEQKYTSLPSMRLERHFREMQNWIGEFNFSCF